MATELEEQRIDVADLRVGMFVCRLDRPWEETPFPLQGLELLGADDIEAIRTHCAFVYIDARRLLLDTPLQALTRTHLADSRFENTRRYADSVSFDDELPQAQKALELASAMVDRIFEEVAHGRELSAEQVEQAVRPLVASILRNADVFFWIEGLRGRDGYSYRHAINCSALAAAFGRHMGLAEETIISVAAGGLLMDVGKTRLPESLLQRAGPLDENEVTLVRSHVEHGLAILASSSITDTDVADIVRTHHERYDGSGYPHRLAGRAIPLVGRMLGIIDAYDAMTTPRPYRAALSRHRALRHIYAARDTLFQSEMVEQFQVCLGVYPTGSLVELSTGEIAVVAAQNQVRRLRPRVVVLSTPDRQPLSTFRRVDLMQSGTGQPEADIVRSLTAAECGIDPAELFLS